LRCFEDAWKFLQNLGIKRVTNTVYGSSAFDSKSGVANKSDFILGIPGNDGRTRWYAHIYNAAGTSLVGGKPIELKPGMIIGTAENWSHNGNGEYSRQKHHFVWLGGRKGEFADWYSWSKSSADEKVIKQWDNSSRVWSRDSANPAPMRIIGIYSRE
jgi:hypothetical protein